MLCYPSNLHIFSVVLFSALTAALTSRHVGHVQRHLFTYLKDKAVIVLCVGTDLLHHNISCVFHAMRTHARKLQCHYEANLQLEIDTVQWEHLPLSMI